MERGNHVLGVGSGGRVKHLPRHHPAAASLRVTGCQEERGALSLAWRRAMTKPIIFPVKQAMNGYLLSTEGREEEGQQTPRGAPLRAR